MSSDPSVDGDTLEFDRVVPLTPNATSDLAVMSCTGCQAPIADEYFTVGDEAVCARCKSTIEDDAAPVRQWSLVMRAALFGFGAAIAGGALYYGVIAITDFEIGIVAIAIGYMVGYAVRKGARGRGGRRLQVTAAGLTYLSVGMAYLILVTASVVGESSAAGVGTAADTAATMLTASDTAQAALPAAAGVDSSGIAIGMGGISVTGAALGVGSFLFFWLALPVLVVLGAMPSGLITALIIGIGMYQAWGMTAAPALAFHGPLRVGGRAPSPHTARERGVTPA
jgi:hypothetical protein